MTLLKMSDTRRSYPLPGPAPWRPLLTALAAGLLSPAGLAETAPPALARQATQALPDIDTVGDRLGWMSSAEIAALPDTQRPPLDATCPGAWVTPISPRIYKGEIGDSDAKALADSLRYNVDGEASLEGRVKLSQPGRVVEADAGLVTQNREYARFDGNIRLAEPGLLLTGEQAVVNLNTKAGQLLGSEFISSNLNAHGQAERIRRDDKGVTDIERVVFTTCPPAQRVWSITARDFRIDPAAGRATLRDGTLRLLDIPVMYLPYYRFPTSNARQSGLLQPMIRRTTTGGVDIAAPIYLNLAPNVDATLTPRFFTRRGAMLDGEVRYLSESLGKGTISGGFLPDDRVSGTDRKSLKIQQSATFAEGWSARTNYNYVSDKLYFIDIGRNLLSTSTFFQERVAEVRKDDGKWHFLGRAQGFQTVDKDILQINRPYVRLPQLLLTRDRDLGDGWQRSLRSELTHFSRRIDDGSGPDVDGQRLRIDPELRYEARNDWGYVRPAARLSYLQYNLQGNGVTGSVSPSVALPTLSLDSGVYLDRVNANGSTQTIEPRVFYLYAPYRNQSQLPNFDTVNNTFTYEQIFRGSRFSGGDRVDDAHQVSAGITTRFLNRDGVERFQAGVGQIVFLRDRLVQLPSANVVRATQPTSSFAGKLSANFNDSLSAYGDFQMDPTGLRLSQYSVTTTYLPERSGSVLNTGYRYRRQDDTIGQRQADIALLSFVQPVGVHWSLIGALQYDTKLNQSQQSLFGVSYEDCCWQFRIFRRSLAINSTVVSPGNERTTDAILFELTLKGLGSNSGSIEKYLRNTITGYAQTQINEDVY